MERTKERTCYLPQDIVIAVLAKLPIKSLVRFLCVSKELSCWMRRFTPLAIPNYNESPNCLYNIKGTKLVTSQPQSESTKIDDYDSLTLVLYPEGESPGINYDFPFVTKQGHLIISSCNGVQCLVDNPHRPSSVFLWNPSIHKSVKLPNPIFQHDQGLIGFGYDPNRDDYKLVRVVETKLRPSVEIYSLRNKKWKIHSQFPPQDMCYYHCPYLAYVNGACHWLLSSRNNSDNAKRRDVIFSFHMGHEVSREFDLPNSFVYISEKVVVYKGMLALVPGTLEVDQFFDFLSCVPIWVMKEYGNAKSWTKLFNVDLSFTFGSLGWDILGFRRDTEDLLIKKNSELFLYEQETRKARKLTNHTWCWKEKAYSVANFIFLRNCFILLGNLQGKLGSIGYLI